MKNCEEHNWAPLLAKVGNKSVPTTLFACLNCGVLKVGTQTILISRNRMSMNNLPIKDIQTGTFYAEYDNGNSGASVTIDWNNGQKQKITLTDNCGISFIAPSGPCNLILKVVQDESGRRGVAWPIDVKWPCGNTPMLAAAENAINIVSFYWDGENYYGGANTGFA